MNYIDAGGRFALSCKALVGAVAVMIWAMS
jgi:hypothetical protein